MSHAVYHGFRLEVYQDSDRSFWFKIIDSATGVEVSSESNYKTIQEAEQAAYIKTINDLLPNQGPEWKRISDAK